LFAGPVFARELVITPRRARTYVARGVYVMALLLLMCTAYLVVTGTQAIRDVGDMARFGAGLFQILAPLQLALAVFFSALMAASTVAQEKERRTFTLLLLTSLSNGELVLGGLMASLLSVLTLLLASAPLFMLTTLLGGIGFDQIGRAFAVTLVAVLMCGSLGSTLALWREKPFQALALTCLVLVMWLGIWEVVAAGLLGSAWFGIPCSVWATGFSPWQAILAATRPAVAAEPALGPLGTAVNLFLVCGGGIVAALNLLAVLRVRRWNAVADAPRTEALDETWRRASIWGAEHDAAQDAPQAPPEAASTAAYAASQAAGITRGITAQAGSTAGRTRHVWDNPVLWREIRTWAYGRKMLVIHVIYLVVFGLVAAALHRALATGELTRTAATLWLAPLFLLSLILVNAQAVTALTSERDAKALDLLLVTDLSPAEVIFGKLGGIFYNTKEMILLPMALGVYLWLGGAMRLENLLYVLGGLLVLLVFVAMLGIHAGIVYDNSRSAIATSLGTVFFLFLGVATCMRIMIAFSGSFHSQLAPFLGMMIGGGLGLYVALGARNPSGAIGLAAFLCPLATFYAITSFLLDYTLAVFLVVVAAYGFATAAMLVPALYEFDLATGRTTAGED